MNLTRSASIILLLLLAFASCAHAELAPARIMIGTREAIVSPPALFDGIGVIAPVSVLDSLGVTHSPEVAGKMTITNALGRSGDVELVNVRGKVMLPMDEVAEVVGLDYNWDESKHTLTLLAKLESVEVVDNTLKINCTIPVTCKVSTWQGGGKLIVDVNSTKVAAPANEVYVGSSLVNKVRIGQSEASTARVVLDLEKNVSYKVSSPASAANILVDVAEKLGGVAKPAPKGPQPFSISAIKVEPLDDTRFQVVISTASKGAVTAKMSWHKISLDMPCGTLADPIIDCTGSHAMLCNSKITRGSGGRGVKLDLSLARTMIYDVSVDESSITVLVTIPLKSGGSLADKLVVIDAGHGGLKYGSIDPGARSGKLVEKNVNLAIAKELASALEAKGARVILTRDGDNGLSLAERPEMAVKSGADFFISIHCNSNGSRNSATGIETYYHMYEPSPKLLAEAIHDGVCKVTGMCDRKARSDRSLYGSGLAVLRGLTGTGVPGVLLECGYINNSSDQAKLASSSYRKKLAQGIIKGLTKYIEGD